MKVLAIISDKGGSGKTTTAINLSAALAEAGHRVLLVDADPQGSCAAGLGIPEQRITFDTGDAMKRPDVFSASDYLWRAERNLDLMPGRARMASIDANPAELGDSEGRTLRLASVLARVSNQYDFVCIDCAPNMGLLTLNAIAASQFIIIPVIPDFFSINRLNKQVAAIKSELKDLGSDSSIWMLPTNFDKTNTVAQDLANELYRRHPGRVVPIEIRRDARLTEAASFGQSIVTYGPDSLGASDYRQLAQWFLKEAVAQKESSQPPLDGAYQGDLTLQLPIPNLPRNAESQRLVVSRIHSLVIELDRAYKAAGGSGLTLKTAELFIESPAGVPSRDGGGQ